VLAAEDNHVVAALRASRSHRGHRIDRSGGLTSTLSLGSVLRVNAKVALNLACVTVLGLLALGLGPNLPAPDARIFWEVRLPGAYTEGGTIYHFVYNYSPAFAWWIGPLQVLDFGTFTTLVVMAQLFALAYLVTPPIALVLIAAQVPPIWFNATGGNLDFIAAAVFALALSRPALWGTLLLSKATPGVGLAWHLFRRDWRSVGTALAVTLALAIPSIILFPGEWAIWAEHMLTNARVDSDGRMPFVIRLTFALGLIAYAARTDRIYLVPIAAALLGHTQSMGWIIALAAIPVWRSRLRSHETAGKESGIGSPTTV
jgi:hypothetical protein